MLFIAIAKNSFEKLKSVGEMKSLLAHSSPSHDIHKQEWSSNTKHLNIVNSEANSVGSQVADWW